MPLLRAAPRTHVPRSRHRLLAGTHLVQGHRRHAREGEQGLLHNGAETARAGGRPRPLLHLGRAARGSRRGVRLPGIRGAGHARRLHVPVQRAGENRPRHAAVPHVQNAAVRRGRAHHGNGGHRPRRDRPAKRGNRARHPHQRAAVLGGHRGRRRHHPQRQPRNRDALQDGQAAYHRPSHQGLAAPRVRRRAGRPARGSRRPRVRRLHRRANAPVRDDEDAHRGRASTTRRGCCASTAT